MSAVTMRRSPYGLDSDRADPWQTRAACTGETAHLFTADPRKGPCPGNEVTEHARAVHLCNAHCSVLASCLAAAQAKPPEGMVQGGRQWMRGVGRVLRDPGCGDHCWHLRGAR